MSLYNMIFGKNQRTKEILATLGLDELDIERFRDCHVDKEDGKIVILTRTGGGNREYYPNKRLIEHPNYLYDEDDEYDSTYAYYYFSIPPRRRRKNDGFLLQRKKRYMHKV